jgi:hypothetical protein
MGYSLYFFRQHALLMEQPPVVRCSLSVLPFRDEMDFQLA